MSKRRLERMARKTEEFLNAIVNAAVLPVYLADGKHTNMEGYGVQPDIRVENSPEDNLNGKDRQLEAAVAELLKEIGGK